jgi:hypothetical protein
MESQNSRINSSSLDPNEKHERSAALLQQLADFR